MTPDHRTAFYAKPVRLCSSSIEVQAPLASLMLQSTGSLPVRELRGDPRLTRSRFLTYRDSFPSGPAAIASFYAEPCLTARGGTVRVNETQADTAAIMTAVDQQYPAI
jgi:hypothetical protein